MVGFTQTLLLLLLVAPHPLLWLCVGYYMGWGVALIRFSFTEPWTVFQISIKSWDFILFLRLPHSTANAPSQQLHAMAEDEASYGDEEQQLSSVSRGIPPQLFLHSYFSVVMEESPQKPYLPFPLSSSLFCTCMVFLCAEKFLWRTILHITFLYSTSHLFMCVFIHTRGESREGWREMERKEENPCGLSKIRRRDNGEMMMLSINSRFMLPYTLTLGKVIVIVAY